MQDGCSEEMRPSADKWRIKVINIDIIPSKSYAHRALICAALSKTPTEVICPLDSEDIRATRACVGALAAGAMVGGATIAYMASRPARSHCDIIARVAATWRRSESRAR